IVGKGICFDSGGYSLKNNMRAMFDDMGGAAAALGALRTAALTRLPANLTVVIAACENLISEDAYVPGDIIGSMSGRSVEMLNADAEGRLTLADAITYALREENAAAVVDIATLTGAAAGAVGRRSAVVMSDRDCLMRAVREAALLSCEKVWLLPCDEELRPQLDTPFADLRNSVPGNPQGGGAIIAGLFLREFAEKKPWLHIDMAPVCYFPDGAPASGKGATGWGASLLYHFVKCLIRE
ncbi:MAG: leucyl aminopeptidase family protein, partial [Pyramidobacter sp.]|nr:leucyl aminopeptidase family protein [Pyramidobacter sp.]